MRFVYFGYDFMLPAIRRLTSEGHALLGVFTFEVDNVFNFNTATIDFARRQGAPVILSRPDTAHIDEFLAQGCEVFLSAGYPYKIPPVNSETAYAVNIHPTYLPHARGLMPIPRIILENATNAAGFTAHKMTQQFDAGDILLQKKFPLLPNETVETYTAKIAMRAPDMVSELFNDLPDLWRKARPQSARSASHYPPPTDRDRTLDWNKTTAELDRTSRAFGRFGCLAQTPEGIFIACDATFWKERHNLSPGTIAAITAREMTLACADGYACLKEFYPA